VRAAAGVAAVAASAVLHSTSTPGALGRCGVGAASMRSMRCTNTPASTTACTQEQQQHQQQLHPVLLVGVLLRRPLGAPCVVGVVVVGGGVPTLLL